jgi:hypothetical protein
VVLASSSRTGGQLSDLLLSAANGRVHAAWMISHGSNEGIYVRSSSDNGEEFNREINLVANESASDRWILQMSSAADNVYLAWQQSSEYAYGVTFSASNDGGASFSVPIFLGGIAPSSAAGPVVAAASNSSDVYVMWLPYFQAALAVSHDGGTNFEPHFPLGNSGGDFPVLSAAGGKVYSAWTRDNESGRHNTVYRASFDNGVTFSDEINILEDRDFIAKGMTAIADSAYLVFSGDEVYFMKVA